MVVLAERGAYLPAYAVRFLPRSYSRETERTLNLRFASVEGFSADPDTTVVYLDRERWWIQGK